ncbi:uncharacterized protein EV420DRAFT_1639354 [Desarmillaria tabescens]|uniref:Uncharacterized protein n=1 Tax=Armillaria tabescens TaxID=1929756 RepID=A0AA39NCP5_ARMTA|nr:uncharacterized protein EV420DRAFT_1639354 [Desarmillaria tabescens]KAK0463202.1 hypothetical protein EV420DRAFT_1639354 [Desarmillaria tabescens]
MASPQHISEETVKSMALNKKTTPVEHNFISLAEKMLFSNKVLRDDPQPRADVTVPPTTWVFRPTPAIKADVLELLQTRPFIREEYEDALQDIITAATTGNTKMTVPFDRDDDEEFSDDEEESLEDEEQVPPSSSEPTTGKRRFREEDSTDDREKKKQRLDDGGRSKPSPQYTNPFRGQQIDTKLIRGYVVLGHRGIGKTIFLYYILLLRLQANQPTILQGVFSVSMADFMDVAKLIPDNAWCLVDSNETLQGVPLPITKSSFFIIQAARARKDHLQWQNQVLGIHQYVMKPFTLSELIVGRNRTLNVGESISEVSLEKYRQSYTPSARTAYESANDLDKFMTSFPNLDAVDEEILYHFFYVTPEAGGDRSYAAMQIVSRKVSELMITQSLGL